MFIAILEDNKEDLLELKNVFIKYENITADYYEDDVKLIQSIRNYDAIFLGIQMEGKNGILLAKKIREHYLDIPIIFISWHMEDMHTSFLVHPYDFIRKQHLSEDLTICMKDLIKKNDTKNNYYYLDKKKHISIDTILYFHKYENMIEIHLENNKIVQTRKTLKQIEALNLPQFYRVNNSVIINFKKIEFINKIHECVLLNDEVIEISRSRWNYIKNEFDDYISSTI